MFINLIKQPNGNYCSIDAWGKLELLNCTEEEVIDHYIKNAKVDMSRAYDSTKIITTMEQYENWGSAHISDNDLKVMGFDRPYKELVKHIPRKPVNISYAPCDFATYGKCPNCGITVIDGIGHRDTQCKCGQQLKWGE